MWLYCTKVAIGKSPKLHRKWTGPYYITQLGPNFTYKIRNCATNKEVKSLIDGARLKPYFDPEKRPTNPPAGLEDYKDDLDAGEVNEGNLDVDRNEGNRQIQQNQARLGPTIGKNHVVENQMQRQSKINIGNGRTPQGRKIDNSKNMEQKNNGRNRDKARKSDSSRNKENNNGSKQAEVVKPRNTNSSEAKKSQKVVKYNRQAQKAKANRSNDNQMKYKRSQY